MSGLAGTDIVTGTGRRSPAARVAAATRGGALQIVLVVVALVWLLPTFGLLVESLRDPAAYTSGGWWHALAKPSQLTVSNYTSLLDNSSITASLLNTLKITVPATLAVVLIGAA